MALTDNLHWPLPRQTQAALATHSGMILQSLKHIPHPLTMLITHLPLCSNITDLSR